MAAAVKPKCMNERSQSELEMPHESLKRMLDISVSNLEYSHKMIVMEVENHFVSRNEL